MKFILMFFAIIGLIIGFSGANAAETKVWSNAAELSFVKTGGNTDVETLLVNNTLKSKLPKSLLLKTA